MKYLHSPRLFGEFLFGALLFSGLLFGAILCVLFGNFEVQAQTPSDLVTIEAGELPIILSAPHGGRTAIPGVNPREGKGVRLFNRELDFNTDRLTASLADAIEKRLGKRPFVVIANFRRKGVDANRPAKLAYESPAAKSTYDAYHVALMQARATVIDRWGRGILLDMHGQGAQPDAIFRGTQNGKTATHLVKRFGQEALTGKSSVFGQLAKSGIEVLPAIGSAQREHPGYDGGYIVIKYGSTTSGTLDAIQLEFGRHFRTHDAIESTSAQLANSIAAFSQEYLPTDEQAPRIAEHKTNEADTLVSPNNGDTRSVAAWDFADGSRKGWFELDDDSSTLAVQSESGQLGSLPELKFVAADKTSLKSFATHFPEVQLKQEGDWVKLQFDCRHNNDGFVDRGFRFGLFKSNGTRFTADGDLDFDVASLDDEGYFAVLDLGRSTTKASAVIRNTNNRTDERLWNGKTIAFDDNDGADDPLMFTRDKSFTYTLTLTRNAEGKVDVALKNHLSGEKSALRGTSTLNPQFAVDSIYFACNRSTADFSIDNVVVTDHGSAELGSLKRSNKDTTAVGVYVDEGAGPSVNDLLFAIGKFPNVSVRRLMADDIRSGKLSGLDLLIHPGGSGGGQGRHLGEEGREAIRGFVKDGGGFIGICAGAYVASSHYVWSLNILDAKVLDTKHWNRGSGSVEIAITDAGRGLLRTSKQQVSIHYAQGPLLAPGDRPDIDDYETLATFKTEIANNGAPAGVMKGSTAVAKGKYGRGRVVCFSPHPEMTQGLEPLVQFAIEHVKRKQTMHTTGETVE